MYNFENISDVDKMYEDYFSKIYNYVFYRLLHREKTEDIVSEIFLKVISSLNSFNPDKASFSTWIFTIANNCIIDFYRKNNRYVYVPDNASCLEMSYLVDFDRQCEIILNEDRKILYKALSELSETQRHVISLKYFSDLTNKKIAEITGINESTVSTICSRAISKLRTFFEVPVNNF